MHLGRLGPFIVSGCSNDSQFKCKEYKEEADFELEKTELSEEEHGGSKVAEGQGYTKNQRIQQKGGRSQEKGSATGARDRKNEVNAVGSPKFCQGPQSPVNPCL
jgi:hypothetical protein